MNPRQIKWEDITYKAEPYPWRSGHPTGTKVFASLKGLSAISHTIFVRDRPYVEESVKPLMALELQKKLQAHILKVKAYLE